VRRWQAKFLQVYLRIKVLLPKQKCFRRKSMLRSWVLLTSICVIISSICTPALAIEIFKLQLVADGRSGTLPFTPIPVDISRQEWVIITVNNHKVQIRHSTSIANFVGMRTWYDHPAILIRLCIEDGFEHKNCEITKGDIATLPSDKTIYDMEIDFKYVGGGAVMTRNLQLSPDLKQEEIKSSNLPSAPT
jgi:hypothetical protein